VSGLETGVIFSSYGLDLEQGVPKVVGEFGVNLLELGTTLKAGLTLGLAGVNWVFSAMLSIPSKSLEISATTTLGTAGIVVILEYASSCVWSSLIHSSQLSCLYSISRLEQRLTMPILLATEYIGPLAMCTTVLPCFAGIILYRFVVLPRRRTRRLA
jgi:hypothetical protein